MTESTTPQPIDPPENQGGGTKSSPASPESTEAASYPDYTIASDPPDNQGG